jgi:hypothetical protein
VRRHAAARRQNPLRRDHPAKVLGRRLDADEQDLLLPFRRGDRAIGVEVDLAGRRSRACGQAGRDDRGLPGLGHIEHRR